MTFKRLEIPSLFLAAGEEAEKDVTTLIVKILRTEFNDSVNLINWQDMDQPGNINQQQKVFAKEFREGVEAILTPPDNRG